MNKNVGGVDRSLRVVVGLVLLAYALGFLGSSPYQWVGWIGVVPIFTGLIGWCPAYLPFGLSTCNIKKQ